MIKMMIIQKVNLNIKSKIEQINQKIMMKMNLKTNKKIENQFIYKSIYFD